MSCVKCEVEMINCINTDSKKSVCGANLIDNSNDKYQAQLYFKTMLIEPTVKPVLSGHSKRRPKIGFQDQLSLNAESILQYFLPSLSYLLSLTSLFCLYLTGRLRLVLLYYKSTHLIQTIIMIIVMRMRRPHKDPIITGTVKRNIINMINYIKTITELK